MGFSFSGTCKDTNASKTCYERGQVRYLLESYQELEKRWYILFPCIAFSILRKRMRIQHTVIPDGKPSTVAFTVFAQLCGHKVNETEMGAVLFTENGGGRNFDIHFEEKSHILR